jgi:pyruvate,orthophosphate dikinase
MFSEGNKEMRDLLGGKGANLAEMTAMRLPIPRGFTVTTEACIEYQKQGSLPGELVQEIEDALARVEAETGKTFGHGDNPLLLSVRSGAPVSMPGMMDTVLNLGLNDETLQALTRKTDNPRFTYDCYRRLLHMFGDVVLGVEDERFKEALERKKGDAGVTYDHELGTEQLQGADVPHRDGHLS